MRQKRRNELDWGPPASKAGERVVLSGQLYKLVWRAGLVG